MADEYPDDPERQQEYDRQRQFVEQFAADLTQQAAAAMAKDGRALTPKDAQAIRADAFMRKIAPYLYEDKT